MIRKKNWYREILICLNPFFYLFELFLSCSFSGIGMLQFTSHVRTVSQKKNTNVFLHPTSSNSFKVRFFNSQHVFFVNTRRFFGRQIQCHLNVMGVRKILIQRCVHQVLLSKFVNQKRLFGFKYYGRKMDVETTLCAYWITLVKTR